MAGMDACDAVVLAGIHTLVSKTRTQPQADVGSFSGSFRH